jgi:hypothetical protein
MLFSKASYDYEVDCHHHPGVSLECMNLLVCEHADDQRQGTHDQNCGRHRRRHLCVSHVVKNLCFLNGIHHCPADLIQEIDERNHHPGYQQNKYRGVTMVIKLNSEPSVAIRVGWMEPDDVKKN